jgi:hypothetical protein
MALTSVAEANLAVGSSGTVLSDRITVSAVLTEESAPFGKETREETGLVDGLWAKHARRRAPEAVTFCLVGSGGQLATRNVSVSTDPAERWGVLTVELPSQVPLTVGQSGRAGVVPLPSAGVVRKVTLVSSDFRLVKSVLVVTELPDTVTIP